MMRSLCFILSFMRSLLSLVVSGLPNSRHLAWGCPPALKVNPSSVRLYARPHGLGIVEVIMANPEIDALPVVVVTPAGRLDRCLFFQVAVAGQPVDILP